MATVYSSLTENDKPTAEQLAEIENAKKSPVKTTYDTPEMSKSQLFQIAEAAREYRAGQKKDVLSIRVSHETVEKAKSLGKGYTNILSSILEYVLNDEEILKKCLGL